MPKIKTRRGVAKRFSKTGTGLYLRRQQNKRHILTKKNAKRKMHLRGSLVVSPANHKAIAKMVPYL